MVLFGKHSSIFCAVPRWKSEADEKEAAQTVHANPRATGLVWLCLHPFTFRSRKEALPSQQSGSYLAKLEACDRQISLPQGAQRVQERWSEAIETGMARDAQESVPAHQWQCCRTVIRILAQDCCCSASDDAGARPTLCCAAAARTKPPSGTWRAMRDPSPRLVWWQRPLQSWHQGWVWKWSTQDRGGWYKI